MLFDLRSRGRRGTVRVVFGGMAVLFAFAFVGVGVGAGFGSSYNIGELFSGTKETSYGSRVTTARKLTQREPANAGAWQRLVEAQLLQATESEYSSETAGFTSKGKHLLANTQRAWERYLALEPKSPSVPLAKRMLTVLGEEGVDQPAAEVQTLQIVIAAEPSNRAWYAALAQYAYKAGNSRQGDLAGEKALSLTPKSERARLRGELSALKKQASSGATSSSTASPTSATTTVKAG